MKFYYSLRLVSFALIVIAARGAVGADPAALTASTNDFRVFPKIVRLHGKDARQQLLVSVANDGRMVDVTRKAQFSINRRLIQITETGIVTSRESGQAELTVTFENHSLTIPVEVKQAEVFLPLDFRNDIVPILTRRGCNSGSCHGKSTGRGGFRLSLFGYNPPADYDWVTRDAAGRRVAPQDPSNSLLLLKPSMAVAHGGGLRLRRNEPEFRRLARWIGRNAPQTSSQTAPTLERIDVFPPAVSLRPGEQQQFVTTAHYSDGSMRDVTRLVKFHANVETIAEIDEWGLVTAGDRIGETAITASFSGQVAISRVRRPLDREWIEPEFPIRNFIDQLVLEKLKSLRIPPSPMCNDSEFLRRQTQQIAGRLPTLDEVNQFAADTSTDKRQQLTQRLLNDPGYADHFAQKWSGILRNKRRGQKPRMPGTIAFHRWIRNAIARNVPYDQFVRQILTATGNVNVNPPVQWYAEVRYLDRFVDDSAQLFLGMRIGCARCHHHPFEKISQEDYFGLAAFFSRVARKGGAGVAERRANEEIFVKPTGSVKHPVTGKVVAPHGLGEPDLLISAFQDPRHKLVDWMSSPTNPYFARAFVNRMWAHFFGRGLVDPLDDLRVTNPASNEPLLDALARKFIDSGFDMRHMVELICSSTTYKLSSKPNNYNLDETQNFSRFYPQRLKAELLLDAIDRVTGVATGYGGLPKGTRALQLPDEGYSNNFLKLFGRPERESSCECERAAEPSLSQSLFVMNDQFILGKLASNTGLARKLSADKRSQPAKVRELFLKTFSREPNQQEQQNALNYLKSESDQKKAYANLLWALLNTKEFLYVH